MTCCKRCGLKHNMICTRKENNNRRDVCRICHRRRACGNWRYPKEAEICANEKIVASAQIESVMIALPEACFAKVI